jgi:aryl-alcohol dehydrogenase-like predicted oxidoreductase
VKYSLLGRTGLLVSRLSFGASALGGVFGPVEESVAVRAVHAALECGINYFDVAPAYGGEQAELRLGKALRSTPRDRYYLSTKVGKYTHPGAYGADTLDYSRQRIRQSVDESASRLGVDYFDILHLHDIEYQHRRHTEWALGEGLDAVMELKREGRVGAVGFGFYPTDLWMRILRSVDLDAALVHNHYCLNDTQLLDLLPAAGQRGIGIINGSPFASGLLTEHGAPSWHPATAEARALVRRASDYCREAGFSLTRLAIQFASQNPSIPTTLFSSFDAQAVEDNVRWSAEPYDPELLSAVQRLLEPMRNQEWNYV